MSMDWAHLWAQMSPLVKGIMVLLVFLSIYSVAVFIERLLTFNKARKQSVKFALEIGQLLKQDKIREGIDLAKKYKESHVAKVVS
ncbi:MAG TPA: flagellar motor protein MotA, partial [Acidobacteriota bacterium]|nr:flagellar motor protein MotA [Acidobacteriota bacterium]